MDYEQRPSGLVTPKEQPKPLTQKEISKAYRKLHHVCPECGNDDIESTCIGYIFSDLETAKDQNQARCLECGWDGIVHQLVKEGQQTVLWQTRRTLKAANQKILQVCDCGRKGFVTCNSSPEGEYAVVAKFETLKDAQEFYSALVDLGRVK